jgi:transposase
VERRGYPPDFRRKVFDLRQEGGAVAEVAHVLGISQESVYSWRRQGRIDRGLVPGVASREKAELTSARKRIAELETGLQAARRAVELSKESADPKGGTRRRR